MHAVRCMLAKSLTSVAQRPQLSCSYTDYMYLVSTVLHYMGPIYIYLQLIHVHTNVVQHGKAMNT